jgi:putative endonuclease
MGPPWRDRARTRRERGRLGEALAEQYLRARGARILARNLHLRHAEIDLLALHRGVLCVVEVRLRSGPGFGSALESVDPRKQRRLAQAAAALLARGGLPPHRALRFDVIAIDASRDPPHLEHIPDAFSATR